MGALAILQLAQESTGPKPETLARGLTLWIALATLVLALIGVAAAAVLARHRRRVKARLEAQPRRTRQTPDAWAEAGRRIQTRGVGDDDETPAVDPPDDNPNGDGGANGDGGRGDNDDNGDNDNKDDNGGTQSTAAVVGADRPVALITGAARRVGLAIAEAFASRGYDLVLTYSRSREEALAARQQLEALGVAVQLEELDLDDSRATDALAARLARTLPRLDALVHNASIYGETPLDGVTADAALRYYRVNAIGPLLLTRRLAPRLAESPRPGGGSVVAMADMHVLGRPRPRHAAYAMSKAALVEMVRTLARELAPRVRVNAVAPGVVAFPEGGREADPAVQAAYISRVPLGRSGTPADAAEAVRWLSMDATYVTGEVIRLDGGRWLA